MSEIFNDFTQRENYYIEKWNKENTFKFKPDYNKSPFTIILPPPNVTGSLHIGHALTFSLQDILIRYNKMKGKDVLWQSGLDHAGIATQMIVERQLGKGKTKKDLGREAFVEKIWSWKEESGGMIKSQMKCLGAALDWSRERFTMDESSSKAVLEAFVRFYNDGLIYQDTRLIYWDPQLQTALSELEVENKSIKSSMYYIAYPLEGENDAIIVATTRPETMFGDVAICVHPEDERYQNYIGKKVRIPLTNTVIPIIGDSILVDPEKESGVVKVTPAHDFNDYEVGKRHNLEMPIILSKEMKMIGERVPQAYQGLERYDARKKVVEDLSAEGFLIKEQKIEHTVPFGDRSGVVLEPMLTTQWFLDAKKLAGPAIEAVEKGEIKFVPERWENTYFSWLKNIQPWCISRQLWWGHRIPAWFGPDSKVFVAVNAEEAKKMAKNHYGKDVDLVQDEDVLDTWFSSGLWPLTTLGWPNDSRELARYYPTDVLATGFDIIFFWVARMVMMGMYLHKSVPFKKVYINSLVRDAKGQKMSKTKGNVIDPLDLINKFGADAVRFVLSKLAVAGHDILLAENKVEEGKHFITKIQNATRYVLMQGKYDKYYDVSEVKHSINKWILKQLVEIVNNTEFYINEYNFHAFAETIYNGFWGTFCSTYIEMSKILLRSDDKALVEETKATLYFVLKQFALLFNPVMPFIAEDLWLNVFGEKESIYEASWPELSFNFKEEEIEEVEYIVKVVAAIRGFRSTLRIAPGLVLSVPKVELNNKLKDHLIRHKAVVESMARINLLENSDEESILGCAVPLGKIFFALEGVDLNIEFEKKRIQDEISKYDGDITKLSSRLNNEDFCKKAPLEVIQESKEKLDLMKLESRKLQELIKEME